MHLVDQLEQAMRDYLIAQIGALRDAPDPDDPLRDVLLAYANWRARQIPARPRAVHRSGQLMSSDKAVEHRDELDALVAMIVTGDDLTPHLSRGAQTINRRDRMLADWGIQHLHLTPEGGPDVVFGVFRDDDAYLIGIYPHESWALQEVVEIAVRSWPEAEIFQRLNYVVGTTQTLTDEERADIRQAGVSASIVEVDGEVYVAGAIAQTLDGSNVQDVMRINTIMHQLRDLRANLEERLEGCRDHAEKETGQRPTGEWQPLVRGGSFGFVADQIFVPIGHLD